MVTDGCDLAAQILHGAHLRHHRGVARRPAHHRRVETPVSRGGSAGPRHHDHNHHPPSEKSDVGSARNGDDNTIRHPHHCVDNHRFRARTVYDRRCHLVHGDSSDDDNHTPNHRAIDIGSCTRRRGPHNETTEEEHCRKALEPERRLPLTVTTPVRASIATESTVWDSRSCFHTRTLNVPVDVLPVVSLAVQFTTLTPIGNSEPEAGLQVTGGSL